MITETQREKLIEAVGEADVVCPEQVCDMVIESAEIAGYGAGLATLAECVANDPAERKTIGH